MTAGLNIHRLSGARRHWHRRNSCSAGRASRRCHFARYLRAHFVRCRQAFRRSCPCSDSHDREQPQEARHGCPRLISLRCSFADHVPTRMPRERTRVRGSKGPCGPSRPTRVGPVATQPQPVLDVGVVVFQPFASRAAIDIVLGQIAKSCLPKRPSDLAADVSGFGISL